MIVEFWMFVFEYKIGKLRGNEPSSNPPNPSEKRADTDEIVRI
jgi:hypothetical protein